MQGSFAPRGPALPASQKWVRVLNLNSLRYLMLTSSPRSTGINRDQQGYQLLPRDLLARHWKSLDTLPRPGSIQRPTRGFACTPNCLSWISDVLQIRRTQTQGITMPLCLSIATTADLKSYLRWKVTYPSGRSAGYLSRENLSVRLIMFFSDQLSFAGLSLANSKIPLPSVLTPSISPITVMMLLYLNSRVSSSMPSRHINNVHETNHGLFP
ncbi:hypothetical protein GGR54DRAFT_464660 [Hypoxylon sp. NC1633]|nr:hypothetical protein GGR54DRAFT_464660 [Hypoxylon sp. NC1633]